MPKGKQKGSASKAKRPRSRQRTPRAKPASGPLADETRAAPWPTRLMLAVRAGGRCEFPGCNTPLFEHHVTLTTGNFGQFAHIRAFSPAGPRGGGAPRPRDVHDIENLLLLCHKCHKLIDDHPNDYSTGTLKLAKSDHEKRIAHLTGLGPDKRTVVVQLKARINGEAVEIPLADVTSAVTPRYPTDRHGYVIDITQFGDEDLACEAARRKVRTMVERLYEPGMDADKVRHISLFALGPIPMLVYLGSRLSNKIPVEFYQRHRDTKDWLWKIEPASVEYEVRAIRRGTDQAKVAVVLPLSGTKSKDKLPASIDETFSVYELGLPQGKASPDFLRTRDDLTKFERTYRGLLAKIEEQHRGVELIHLFPAVPAPIAVACGYNLLQKVHPPLLVYDFVSAEGGWVLRLRTDDLDAH